MSCCAVLRKPLNQVVDEAVPTIVNSTPGMLMLIVVLAETGNVIVSPASFPTPRTVPPVLHFGGTGVWNIRQRKYEALLKSFQP